MAHIYMRTGSTSLIMREIHTKITTRYHLTPARMSIIKKGKFGEDVEKREPLCTIGGNVNWCSHHGKQYIGSLKY